MVRLIRNLVRQVQTSFEKRRYDPTTMAEYWRKQGVQVGVGCYIIPTVVATEPYLVKIGNHVTIAAGVEFVTHDGGVWIFRDEVPDFQVFGPIVIEDNCVIGARALIFPNVRIGPNSIVSAGSVVISDVPPNTIAMGSPARPIGSVQKYREKCLERWQAQRPPGVVIEQGKTWWTSRNFVQNRESLRRHLMELFAQEMNPPAKESRQPPRKDGSVTS